MDITCGSCGKTNPYHLWDIIDDEYWCPACKTGIRRTAGKLEVVKVGDKYMIIPGEIKVEVI